MNNQHDPFEEQLRNALRGQSGQSPDPDVDSFLDQVHRGSRRRRTTRIVAGTAAAVCLVVGGSFALAVSGVLDDGGRAPIADDTTGTSLGSESPNSILSATTPGTTAGDSASSEAATPRFTAEQIVALDITATGNSHQWILGSVPGGDCDAKRCLHVFRTENAGGSWADLGELPAHPIVGTEDGGSVGGLRIAGDGVNGWAFKGALLGTHDGGETWARQEVPIRDNVVQVESWGEDALAVTYDGGRGATLLHSEVGSDTWEVVPFAEQADLTDPQASVGDVAISQDAAIMTVYSVDGGTVLISNDGGRTWGPPASSEYCDLGAESASLVSVTADSLWVSCTRLTGRAQTTVSVSSDLGSTWQRAGGTFGNGAQIGGRDADTVAVAEGAGAYQVSATEIWLAQVPAESQPERIGTFGDSAATMVEFTNPETGYIVFGGGGLLRTGDGGQSWAPFGVTDLE